MYSWVVDALVLGADAALVLLFYKLYKSKIVASDLVKSATSFNIDENLAAKLQSQTDHRVAYACVHGTVQPAEGSQLLTSKYTSDTGVIRRWTFDKLKSKYVNGSWSDYNVVKSGSEAIPFCLLGNVAGRVDVEGVSRATVLDETLTLTYNHFTPNQTGFVDRVLNWFGGSKIKGFRTTERMLKAGTALFGFGELSLEHGQVRLRAPMDDGVRDAAFMLTHRSKDELIQTLREPASLYRTLAILCCLVGALWLWVSLGRRLHNWYQSYRQLREMQLLTGVQAAVAASASGGGEAVAAADGIVQPVHDSTVCVVCLEAPRAIANLNCRHMCMCLDCYEAIPAPKLCPVCREPIVDVMPIYMP